MRRFYVDPEKVSGRAPLITGPDAKHIKTVLRLKPGDKIGLFDGAGNEYEAVIVNLSASTVKVSVLRRLSLNTESPVQIIVAQALLKDRKMDTLVRQLTELGITEWIPFTAERSVPRPHPARLQARMQRWKKIAKEALKQCRRSRMPLIEAALPFEEVLKIHTASDLKIVFWEEESRPIHSQSTQLHGPLQKIFLMLGPEGGFTSREIEIANASGFITASLGPRILRAETATIAACTLIQYLFGDMGQKNLDKTLSFA